MFYRDEVSGFIDAITRKEYLSGMIETLTHLYDSPRIFRRMLKKEIIHVQEPIFIFFGGGVTEELYSKLGPNHITSGFLPRFLVVSGHADQSQLRPTFRPSEENMNLRNKVYSRMSDIHHIYNQTRAVKLGNDTIQRQPLFNVELTDDAWEKYQFIETTMLNAASDSDVQLMALPTYERLARSCLKMSMLLAAARQEPNENDVVTCGTEDVTNAAYYLQRWARFSVDIIYNVGKTGSTREMERVRDYIRIKPGVPHSDLMRKFHLTKRNMDEIIDTLQDRAEIRKIRRGGKGGGNSYWPL
jgi:hypothetical protein